MGSATERSETLLIFQFLPPLQDESLVGMSSRLSNAEIVRFQSFITEAFNREASDIPTQGERAVQEQFWTRFRACLTRNPQSTGLEHLDAIAQSLMDGAQDPTLGGTVLVLPPHSSATGTPSGQEGDLEHATFPKESESPAPATSKSTKGKGQAKAAAVTKATKGKAPAKRKASANSSTSASASKKARSSADNAVKSKNTSDASSASRAALVEVSPAAPKPIHEAVDLVLSKSKAAGKSPWRLAYPWKGRPLWYDPVIFPHVHRLHWRFWMAHRRAFWLWAFHAPATATVAAHRRKIKFRACQARLVFMSVCIETWGFYAFLGKLDTQPELFWYGGQPGRTSNALRNYKGPFPEDLTYLWRKDRNRFDMTVAHALNPNSIDSWSYPSMRSLLETTDALNPAADPENRLSDRALPRVRRDVMSAYVPSTKWAGKKTEDPWKTLVNSNRIKLIQDSLMKELNEDTYKTPKAGEIAPSEAATSDYSDLEGSEVEADEGVDDDDLAAQSDGDNAQEG